MGLYPKYNLRPRLSLDENSRFIITTYTRSYAAIIVMTGVAMIDLYYAPTPNGHKITLFLEEAQLDYRILPVDISKGEQFRPEFLAISPNNKIPAIVDHEPDDGGAPLSLFESGEILLYLAEKSGKLLSGELRERSGSITC